MERAPQGVAQSTTLQTYWRHFRRNLLSVGFPVLVTWAIYADWSRTKQFKIRQAEIEAKNKDFEKLPEQ